MGLLPEMGKLTCLRTQQFEEILQDRHGIVVFDQAKQETCVD